MLVRTYVHACLSACLANDVNQTVPLAHSLSHILCMILFSFPFLTSEFSKLSMGPLWAEILDHIDPVLNEESEDRPRPPAKLAIYSGYDSTIMEVLASLGAWAGEVWPPYASMVLLEVCTVLYEMDDIIVICTINNCRGTNEPRAKLTTLHFSVPWTECTSVRMDQIHEYDDDARDQSIFESRFAFRLLYNGEVLTDKVEGCTAGMELCDARHLVNRVKPFARRNVDCIDVNLEKGKIHPTEVAKALITTTGGIILVVLIITLSAFIGSIAGMYRCIGTSERGG